MWARLAAAALCVLPAAGLLLSPPAGLTRPRLPRVVCARLSAGDDREWSADDELDAADTTSSWEEELAESKAWQAKQAPADEAWAVDEEAHLGLDDDDDEPRDDMLRRQLAEKQAALMLDALEGEKGAAEEPRVLESLKAVLSSLSRLEQKLDRLEKKVDGLSTEGSAAAPAGPSAGPDGGGAAPARFEERATPGTDAPTWDGEVDEAAYFDDDGDALFDMPDWRDVRRLKRMMEAGGDAGGDEADPDGGAGGKAKGEAA